MDIDKLFASAEENTEKLQSNQSSKGKRDERFIDIRTPKGVTRKIYFRMFLDATKSKPVSYLPYQEYSFKSFSTGKMIYAGISSTVFDGKQDYFKSRQSDVWDANEKAGIAMYPQDKRLVNMYVIKDTHVSSNDDQFKLMRYGAKPVDPDRPRTGSPMMKCFKKITDEASDNEIQPMDLYSLGKGGVTLVMTIVGDDKIPDITVDYFDKGKKVQGFTGFDKEAQIEAYTKKAVDLMEVVGTPRSEEDLEKLIRVHLLCEKVDSSTPNINDEPSTSSYFGEDDDDDEIPMGDSDPVADAKAGKPASGSEELDGLLEGMQLE